MLQFNAGGGEPTHDAGHVSPRAGTDFGDILVRLRHHGLAIVGGTLVGAVLGLVIAGLVPRLFTATAEIMVDPRGLRVFENTVVPTGQTYDVQTALIESQARVLKSDSVLAPVVAEQDLARDPEFNGAMRGLAETIAGRLTARLPAARQDPDAAALATLGNVVRVSRVPDSYVLQLSVSSRDGTKAARLADAIVAAYRAQQEAVRNDASKRVGDGLAERLDALGTDLQRAEAAVDDFRRQHNLVDANGRPVNEQQLATLTDQLTAARVRTAELRARADQLGRIGRPDDAPAATSDALQSGAIAALLNRYAEVKQQRDTLLTSLGPRHPALIAATAQLRGVRQLIAAEGARVAAAARADLRRAEATEQALDRQVASTTATAGTANTATVRLHELERDAAARRAVYESLLTRYRETEAQSDLPTVNIAVISPAAIPVARSGVPAMPIVVLAALLGAAAGAAAGLARDSLAGRLRSPRQMTSATGWPLLAAVRRPRGLRWPRGASRTAQARPDGLSQLQNAVMNAAPDRPPRILLLVSVAPAVAALALPLDIAEATTRQGESVLLVDADDDRLTRPLAGAEAAERRAWTALRRTPVRNLSVLVWSAPFIGPGTPDHKGGADALRRFAADYGLVMIHAPLGSETVRLRPLAAVATTIVLLADATASSIAQVEALLRDLGPDRDKVAGYAWVTPERLTAQRAGTGARPAPRAQAWSGETPR